LLTDATRQADFPSLFGRTYLNTAAEGIPPRPVVRALAQYAQDKLLGMDGRELHRSQWEGAREQVAMAYGLTPTEVGICSCSSEAYNLASMALGVGEGDEVIVNDLDFPAGSTPWLQPACPAETKVWRSRDGALLVEDLAALLGPRTRLVSVSLVSFYNGFRVPLPEVVETVRRLSPALIAVDATQALGRIPLDLGGVDLIVSSTHKWILASHGGGLVGVPSGSADRLTVPAGGWFNLQDPFRQERFDTPAESKAGAESFMVGMPNYAAIYAINAALHYINALGPVAIDAYARPLVQAVVEGLKNLPVELITPDRDESLAGIVAFRHPDAERLHRALHEENIHVMCQAGRVRIAIHGYNTIQDIESFLATLSGALKP
jgi:cysteine desulfurase/selenocysteine lyase